MMGTAALLAFLVMEPGPPEAQTGDESQTRLDRTFERADEHLGRASGFTCREGPARRAYQELAESRERLSARAEALLGRQLHVTVTLWECLARYDDRAFTHHKRRARYFLRRVERMIQRGETD